MKHSIRILVTILTLHLLAAVQGAETISPPAGAGQAILSRDIPFSEIR